MSLQICFSSLLNNQSQVLPSLSYLSSLFKQHHHHQARRTSVDTPANNPSSQQSSRDILELSLDRARQSVSQLFTQKESILIIDKLLNNYECPSKAVSSNDFHRLTKLLLQSDACSHNDYYNKNNNTNIKSKPETTTTTTTNKFSYSGYILNNVSLNNYRNTIKLLNGANQYNFNTRRYYATKKHYTGIGGLRRNHEKNRDDFTLRLYQMLGTQGTKPETNEKLKSLINDPKIDDAEKQRLKIAFAEGYGAAEPKVTTRMRAFSLVRDLSSLIVVLVVVASLFGIGNSFRKFIVGDQNTPVFPEDIDVTFENVMGVEEAKNELKEIVEFLKNPNKFSNLGGKLPKGVLLVGPPGTGKTLLARAVAGEAGVPFLHVAGPEFDEILVGQGARRVRDLFATAKKQAPCVVFIDEIDSVGSKRTSSVLHPYANQTINQLLTEMDGFRQNAGVIVLGATNRRDDLDRALIRPGRFDVEIQVPLPDYEGRKQILELYLKKIKYSPSVDLNVLARGTTGFTGADLENMVNQAALRAAIDGLESVSMLYLENARDKVLMGPAKKSRIPDEESNRITAYHEAGHALVAYYTKDSHPLHKVTIIPRGPSLGHTAYIPEKESYHITRAQMQATLDTLMGGRVAEELIFGAEKVTTGASDDLKKATSIATSMVKDYGMSDKVGVRTFDEEHGSLVVVNELSNNTAELIDTEIKRILQESYDRAKNILQTYSAQHNKLAQELLIKETLNATDIKTLLAPEVTA